MKYKIEGTFEVEFDTKNADGLESVLSQDDRDQLATEWLHEGCDLISEKLVPCLEGHTVRLTSFQIQEGSREINE